jgi:galactokinase
MIGVDSLRDASRSQVEDLPTPLRQRARHVVTENERTIAAAEALLANDVAALGELMNQSHRSMRDDFEVVPPRLDALAAAVRAIPGCLGARLTGGGFGGATVNLVYPDTVEAVRAKAESLGAVVYVSRAADGVEVTGRRAS